MGCNSDESESTVYAPEYFPYIGKATYLGIPSHVYVSMVYCVFLTSLKTYGY